MEKTSNTKKLVQVGLLIAIEIVLSRFLSISTPIAKIGFAFLPIAMIGMMYGPVYAGAGAAIGDLLGALLFPIGAYFPGFTVTALLTGVTYGLLLHKNKSWLRITVAVLITTLGLSLCLSTFWLYLITGKGYLALLPPRILQNVIMIPIEMVGIRFAWTKLCSRQWMMASAT